MEKECTKCRKMLSVDCFWRNKTRKDDFSIYCKDCSKKFNKTEASKRRSYRWMRDNNEKCRAYDAVKRALKKGVLIKKPCQICGNKKVHAHHEDYNKRLEVIWFCPKHHTEHHKKS